MLQLIPFVRMEGLEPPRVSPPDPKSGAATNYATCARRFFHSKALKFLQPVN